MSSRTHRTHQPGLTFGQLGSRTRSGLVFVLSLALLASGLVLAPASASVVDDIEQDAIEQALPDNLSTSDEPGAEALKKQVLGQQLNLDQSAPREPFQAFNMHVAQVAPGRAGGYGFVKVDVIRQPTEGELPRPARDVKLTITPDKGQIAQVRGAGWDCSIVQGDARCTYTRALLADESPSPAVVRVTLPSGIEPGQVEVTGSATWRERIASDSPEDIKKREDAQQAVTRADESVRKAQSKVATTRKQVQAARAQSQRARQVAASAKKKTKRLVKKRQRVDSPQRKQKLTRKIKVAKKSRKQARRTVVLTTTQLTRARNQLSSSRRTRDNATKNLRSAEAAVIRVEEETSKGKFTPASFELAAPLTVNPPMTATARSAQGDVVILGDERTVVLSGEVNQTEGAPVVGIWRQTAGPAVEWVNHEGQKIKNAIASKVVESTTQTVAIPESITKPTELAFEFTATSLGQTLRRSFTVTVVPQQIADLNPRRGVSIEELLKSASRAPAKPTEGLEVTAPPVGTLSGESVISAVAGDDVSITYNAPAQTAVDSVAWEQFAGPAGLLDSAVWDNQTFTVTLPDNADVVYGIQATIQLTDDDGTRTVQIGKLINVGQRDEEEPDTEPAGWSDGAPIGEGVPVTAEFAGFTMPGARFMSAVSLLTAPLDLIRSIAATPGGAGGSPSSPQDCPDCIGRESLDDEDLSPSDPGEQLDPEPGNGDGGSSDDGDIAPDPDQPEGDTEPDPDPNPSDDGGNQTPPAPSAPEDLNLKLFCAVVEQMKAGANVEVPLGKGYLRSMLTIIPKKWGIRSPKSGESNNGNWAGSCRDKDAEIFFDASQLRFADVSLTEVQGTLTAGALSLEKAALPVSDKVQSYLPQSVGSLAKIDLKVPAGGKVTSAAKAGVFGELKGTFRGTAAGVGTSSIPLPKDWSFKDMTFEFTKTTRSSDTLPPLDNPATPPVVTPASVDDGDLGSGPDDDPIGSDNPGGGSVDDGDEPSDSGTPSPSPTVDPTDVDVSMWKITLEANGPSVGGEPAGAALLWTGVVVGKATVFNLAASGLVTLDTEDGSSLKLSGEGQFDTVSKVGSLNVAANCVDTLGAAASCRLMDGMSLNSASVTLSNADGITLSADFTFHVGSGDDQTDYQVSGTGAYQSRDDWSVTVASEAGVEITEGISITGISGTIGNKSLPAVGNTPAKTVFIVDIGATLEAIPMNPDLALTDTSVTGQLTNMCDEELEKQKKCTTGEMKLVLVYEANLGLDSGPARIYASGALNLTTLKFTAAGSFSGQFGPEKMQITEIGLQITNDKQTAICRPNAAPGFAPPPATDPQPGVFEIGVSAEGVILDQKVTLVGSIDAKAKEYCLYGQIARADQGDNGVLRDLTVAYSSYANGAKITAPAFGQTPSKPIDVPGGKVKMIGVFELGEDVSDEMAQNQEAPNQPNPTKDILEIEGWINTNLTGFSIKGTYTMGQPLYITGDANTDNLAMTGISLGFTAEKGRGASITFAVYFNYHTEASPTDPDIPASDTPMFGSVTVGFDSKGPYLTIAVGVDSTDGPILNAFGQQDLTINALGLAGTISANPSISFSAMASLPSDWTEKLEITENAVIAVGFLISYNNVCIAFQLNGPTQADGTYGLAFDLAGMGFLTADLINLVIAPLGCNLPGKGPGEPYKLDPGFSFAFDGTMIGAPVTVAFLVKLPTPSDRSFRVKADIEIPALAIPGVTLGGYPDADQPLTVYLDIDTGANVYEGAISAGIQVGVGSFNLAQVGVNGSFKFDPGSATLQVDFEGKSVIDFYIAKADVDLAFTIDITDGNVNEFAVSGEFFFKVLGVEVFGGADLQYNGEKLLQFQVWGGTSINIIVGAFSGTFDANYCLGNITKPSRAKSTCTPNSKLSSDRANFYLQLFGSLRLLWKKWPYQWVLVDSGPGDDGSDLPDAYVPTETKLMLSPQYILDQGDAKGFITSGGERYAYAARINGKPAEPIVDENGVLVRPCEQARFTQTWRPTPTDPNPLPETTAIPTPSRCVMTAHMITNTTDDVDWTSARDWQIAGNTPLICDEKGCSAVGLPSDPYLFQDAAYRGGDEGDETNQSREEALQNLLLGQPEPPPGNGVMPAGYMIDNRNPNSEDMTVLLSPNKGYKLLLEPTPVGSNVPYNCENCLRIATVDTANVGTGWQSPNQPGGFAFAIMQPDGNLVQYDSEGNPRWATNTAGSGARMAYLDNKGFLSLRNQAGGEVWRQSTTSMTGTGEQVASPESTTTVSLKMGDRCVDGNFGYGAHKPPYLFDCLQSATQQWQLRDSGNIVANQTGLCLSVDGTTDGQFPDGSAVTMVPCDGTDRQVWIFEGTGYFNKAASQCLDTNGPDANFTRLKVTACDLASETQAVNTSTDSVRTYGQAKFQTIRFSQSRLCADHVSNVRPNVQAWDCNYSAAQQWHFESDGTVRTADRQLCLTAPADGSFGNATLTACGTGQVNQRWFQYRDPLSQDWGDGGRLASAVKVPGSNTAKLCLEGPSGHNPGAFLRLILCSVVPDQNMTVTAWSTLSFPDASYATIGMNRKCLNRAGDDPLQQWECNQSAAQRWTMEPNGTISRHASPEMCMGVADGDMGLDSEVNLYPCDGSERQKWLYGAGNLMNEAAELCLAVKGGLPDNGQRYVLWACDPGSPASQVSIVPRKLSTLQYPANAVQAIDLDGMCLERVPDADNAKVTNVELQVCNGTGRQQWKVKKVEGVNVIAHRNNTTCVVAPSGAEPGAVVRLVACDEEHRGQQWKWNGNGFVDLGSGLCLDDGGSPEPGARPRVQTCGVENPNQKVTVIVSGIHDTLPGTFSQIRIGDRCLTAGSLGTDPAWQDCALVADQLFRANSDGSLSLNTTALCVSVPADATVGALVRLAGCELGNDSQMWVREAGKRLKNLHSGLCLTDATENPEGIVKIDVCSQTAQTQRVEMPSYGMQTYPGADYVEVRIGEWCLDNGDDPASLKLWDCNRLSNQRWTLNQDNTIRPNWNSELCVAPFEGRLAEGSPVTLVECDGSRAQRWIQDGEAFVNLAAGRCLDLMGNDRTHGNQFHLWDCNGSAAQEFTVVPFDAPIPEKLSEPRSIVLRANADVPTLSGQIDVTFQPPAATNGQSVTNYTAACRGADGSQLVASSQSQMIAVKGASFNVSYTCTVTATTAEGTGLPGKSQGTVTIRDPFLRKELNQGLANNGILYSADGRMRLTVLTSNVLRVLRPDGLTLWSANGSGGDLGTGRLEWDAGQMRVRVSGYTIDANNNLWYSGNSADDDALAMYLTNNGNLMLFNTAGEVVWQSGVIMP